MTVLVFLVVMLSISYTLGLFVVSRRRRPPHLGATDDLFFVFMVPCLNEELVIGRSLERLLALSGDRYAVLVIDDGSDDATASVVASYDDPRVWMLRRARPDAQLGKGEALNAAFRHLRDSGLLGSRASDDVIVVVIDADGRLAGNALHEVGPYFRDPKTAAVQVGVRMYNADAKLIARMQDFEFVTFTEIFQRGRQRLGSVGLGGNGQFNRLSALVSLGDAPWTDCLTEDLDLGLRFLAAGWSNSFCPTTHVSQQAVVTIRRLIRQRSRWFQGHLQCWKRIPLILRSALPMRATADLVQHLLSPALVLLTSLLLPMSLATMTVVTVASPGGVARALLANGGVLMMAWYLLSFGLSPFYGFVYWLREPDASLLRSLGYAHIYTLYGYLWFPAGWWAVWRLVTRRRGWAKTTRTVDAAPAG